MPLPPASEVLDREFLAIRSKLLDIAAALDRIDRAEGSAQDDSRMGQIRRGVEVTASAAPNRAEQLQMLFSLPFDPQWRQEQDGGKGQE